MLLSFISFVHQDTMLELARLWWSDPAESGDRLHMKICLLSMFYQMRTSTSRKCTVPRESLARHDPDQGGPKSVGASLPPSV